MKSIFTATLILGIVALSGLTPAQAQSSAIQFGWTNDTETYGLLHRPFRMSLVPGLSTNGTDATRYSSRYSINLIAGYNGGLEDGYEIGLININKYYTHARFQLGALNISGGRLAGINLGAIGNYAHTDMQGMQFAGGLNIAHNDMAGIQLSGIGNIAGGDLAGVHYGGIMNVAGGDMSGLQFAGIFNASGSDMSGVQVAGIGNFSGDDLTGMQFAGIGNFAAGDISGLQFAGIGNFGGGEIAGLQFAGIGNVAGTDASGLIASGVFTAAGADATGLLLTGGLILAGRDASGLMASGVGVFSGRDIEGLSVAGVGVIAGRDISGLAVSGVLNAANTIEGLAVAGFGNFAQDITGLSVAGFANISYSATGLQVAPFNYARHFEGMPVGLISWYGNGRKNIDVWGNDQGFTNIGLKTGTHEIYNMISVGFNPTITDRDVFQLGWHVGRYETLDEAWNNPNLSSFFVKKDWSVTLIQDDEWFNADLNRVYAYRYLLGATFAEGFRMYAGPSLNLLVSKHPNRDNYTPYSIFETSRGDTDFRFWVGFNLGIQLF